MFTQNTLDRVIISYCFPLARKTVCPQQEATLKSALEYHEQCRVKLKYTKNHSKPLNPLIIRVGDGGPNTPQNERG